MSEITGLLQRWGQGDREAFEALLPLVYKELRRIAQRHLRSERKGHTLQPTALVHEAYLRLCGQREIDLENRAHFFGTAARVMRRILVDHARKHRALKRGAGVQALRDLDSLVDLRVDHAVLDDALKALERIAPEKAQVVELRYFGGLSVEETASYLNLSPATVKRHWSFSRAWLYRRLSGSDGLPPPTGA